MKIIIIFNEITGEIIFYEQAEDCPEAVFVEPKKESEDDSIH